MPTLKRALENERGVANPDHTMQGTYGALLWDNAEHTPELQWPLSIAVYDRMRRTDAQVASGNRALKQSLLGRRFVLDPNGADDAVVEHVAQDLALDVLGKPTSPPARTRGRFSFRAHLPLALLHLSYGHMPFEQVYRIEGSGSSARARLRKLAPRFPATIAEIKVARDGGLEGIVQYGDGSRGIDIGVERLVMYTHDREGAAWQGTSLLRPAYKDWLLKDRLLRVNAISGERTGMGLPEIVMPPNTPDTETAKYQALAEAARAGESAGLALPNGAKLRFVGVDGTLPDLIASIRYHDEQIARNVGAMFLQLGTTSSGSRALAEPLIDFFDGMVDALGTELLGVANEHIVEDLVDLNYGEGERAPRIVMLPADDSHAATPEQLKVLVDAGVITVDEALEDYWRNRLRFPARTGPRPAAVAARARAPRVRRVSAAAGDDVPALPLGDLPEPFADLYARRTDTSAAALDALMPAIATLAQAVDLGPVADLALARPDVVAAADPFEQALAAMIEQEIRAQTNALLGLTEQATEGLRTSWAAGQAEGQVLLEFGVDVDYAMVFDEALDAAQDLDSLLLAADDWTTQHVGAASRSAAQAVTDALTGAATRDELIGAMVDDLGSRTNAAVLYDYAVSSALGEGARTRYVDAGLERADFLTAADERVDGVCVAAAASNPHPLADAPTVPQHIGCRCTLAPSLPAIRDLLLGG